MDIYVATNGTIKLMDFNPVGGSTAPLLFDWNELGYGKRCGRIGVMLRHQSHLVDINV